MAREVDRTRTLSNPSRLATFAFALYAQRLAED